MATTIEPGKRAARTAVSTALGVIVAASGIVPGVLDALKVDIPANYYTEAAVAGGILVAVSTGVNAILSIPAVVKILPSWLTPTAVDKTAAAIVKTSDDAVAGAQAVEPDVAAIVADAANGDLTDAAVTTLQDATKDAPEVIASVQQVQSDAAAVGSIQPMG